MAVIFDEVTATVQPASPPADRPASSGSERPPSSGAAPLELVRLLERLAERAARLSAD
jgi:hypothetical protein